MTAISDHDGQLMEISGVVSSTKPVRFKKTVRKFNDDNVRSFLKLLASETWMEVYMADVNHKFEIFHKMLLYYFDVSFPKVTITQHSKVAKGKWMSQDIVNERADLINLERNMRKNKVGYNVNTLKKRKQKLKQRITEARKQFFDNKIKSSSNITKTTWNLINLEVGKDKTKVHDDIVLVNQDGKLIANPKEVCNIFNNFFINVVDQQIVPNTSKNLQQSSTTLNSIGTSTQAKQTKFKFTQITTKKVIKIISSFKNAISWV